MDTYIKTIINGLKSWVASRLFRLESSVSGSLASMADKLTSLSTKVQKNTTDIAQLQAYEDETYALANAAQTTAQSLTVEINSLKKQDVEKFVSGALILRTGCAQTRISGELVVTFEDRFEYDFLSKNPEYARAIYFLIGSASPGCSGNFVHVNRVQIGAGMYAEFDSATDVSVFDVIKISMNSDGKTWTAQKTGISLGAAALDTAYTEGVNSL